MGKRLRGCEDLSGASKDPVTIAEKCDSCKLLFLNNKNKCIDAVWGHLWTCVTVP